MVMRYWGNCKRR